MKKIKDKLKAKLLKLSLIILALIIFALLNSLLGFLEIKFRQKDLKI
jgi:hypothetical protein